MEKSATAAAAASDQIPRDWVALLLGGLGLSTYEPVSIAGGLLLSLALASLIARRRKDRRKLFTVMLTAAIVSILSLQGWSFFYPETVVAPQFIMAVSGGLSGWMINLLVTAMGRTEQRAEDLTDKVLDRVVGDDQ